MSLSLAKAIPEDGWPPAAHPTAGKILLQLWRGVWGAHHSFTTLHCLHGLDSFHKVLNSFHKLQNSDGLHFAQTVVSAVSAGTDTFLMPYTQSPFHSVIPSASLSGLSEAMMKTFTPESRLLPPSQATVTALIILPLKLGMGYQEAPNGLPACQLYSSLPSSWWPGTVVSPRIVIPFLASCSLGRRSMQCPGSSPSSLVLLPCPLMEGSRASRPAEPRAAGKESTVSQCITGSHVPWDLSSFQSLVSSPLYSIYWGHRTIKKSLI